ncbi:MAG: pyridoxal-phosphate dependent enzyme [Lachnospiraceae bacterium]|jgi:threonine dehydratase|nr:pyridoxal-phosphate dependent enzyme [Lachnospiraceae bacterium]
MENAQNRYHIGIDDILAARERIRGYAAYTPLEFSPALSAGGKKVFLKLENQQPVRSFKIRGVMNRLRLLTPAQRSRGIVTISSGNHAIAVAYGAALLGITRCEVIIPDGTPESKRSVISAYGAAIVPMGRNYDEAHAMGEGYVKGSGLYFIDGGDEDTAVCAGQGTIALEILEQNPDIDSILIPFGGGGLAAGIAVAAQALKPGTAHSACAYKPDNAVTPARTLKPGTTATPGGTKPGITVTPLYSEKCPAVERSFREGVFYGYYPSEGSICEAMVGGIGHIAFAQRHLFAAPLGVDEEFVKKGIMHAFFTEKIVAEATGAVPIAACLQHGASLPGTNIALVITGGNLDARLFMDLVGNRAYVQKPLA